VKLCTKTTSLCFSTLSLRRSEKPAKELIVPPEGYLVRAGGGGTEGAMRAEAMSKLGIFGWALFGGGKGEREKVVGWLLDEREAVATGLSVLDSLVLIDDE
jgi:hypothetical protein